MPELNETIMNSPYDLDAILWKLRFEYEKVGPIVILYGKEISEEEKARTLKQNSSLHKYCSIIAEKMNGAGFTQRKLTGAFREGFELPVTPGMVKDIFREVGNAMYKAKSTKRLSTKEIKAVYMVVDQRFGEITGCRAEWPKEKPPLPEKDK